MAQQNAQQIIQNNNLMRQALFQTSPLMRKNLGAISGVALGQTTRQKLYNVGIVTRLIVKVQTEVDIGTANATLSPKAPFNLISRIRLTDYDGVDRINISGSQLFDILCVRRGTYFGYNNESATAVLGAGTASITNMANPTTPTSTGTALPFGFWFEVPLAFDPSNDLRGALLAQTSVGECYLNIDWNCSLITSGSADSVYNGAATSTAILNATYGGIQIQTWQEFYLPQAINGQLPLPQIDLLTVYELAGNIKSTDNIAANTEKLINLPNVRSVIGTYVEFVNNGVMNSPGTDMSQVRLIANGNNVLYDNRGRVMFLNSA